jgi:hypothetical protein
MLLSLSTNTAEWSVLCCGCYSEGERSWILSNRWEGLRTRLDIGVKRKVSTPAMYQSLVRQPTA